MLIKHASNLLRSIADIFFFWMLWAVCHILGLVSYPKLSWCSIQTHVSHFFYWFLIFKGIWELYIILFSNEGWFPTLKLQPSYLAFTLWKYSAYVCPYRHTSYMHLVFYQGYNNRTTVVSTANSVLADGYKQSVGEAPEWLLQWEILLQRSLAKHCVGKRDTQELQHRQTW